MAARWTPIFPVAANVTSYFWQSVISCWLGFAAEFIGDDCGGAAGRLRILETRCPGVLGIPI